MSHNKTESADAGLRKSVEALHSLTG